MVERTTPTFLGWTDLALKERQADEISTNSFGKGAFTERVELAHSSRMQSGTGNSPKSVETIRKVRKLSCKTLFIQFHLDLVGVNRDSLKLNVDSVQ